MRRILWGSFMVVAVVACGRSASPQPNPLAGGFDPANQPGVKDRVALISFSGPNACVDLKQHLEDRAVLQMQVQLASSKRYMLQTWEWRRTGTWGSTSSDGAMDAGAAAGGGGGGGGGGSGSAGPSAYTTTNTQMAGVDEPDFVKNDGSRIFVLLGQRLYAAQSWPASALARRGSLAIDGTPREMFLDGDRLVVFSEVFDPTLSNLPSYCLDGCGGWYRNATRISVIDASDLSNLRETQTHVVPGQYRTARRIGASVRLVVSDDIALPAGVATWPDYRDWDALASAPGSSDIDAYFDALATANEQVIRARTLDQWIPAVHSAGVGTTARQPLDCARVAAPDVSGELGLASVVTVNLDAPAQVSRTTLLAQAHEVYASPGALYIAQLHWWWWDWTPQRSATYLHKFDLSDPNSVAWVGSGAVDGTIVDQFSMDERQGYLRVATTWNEPADFWRTHNAISVLSETAGALVKVGQSPDVGAGERIMSTRFVGPSAYVVTFRQTDPLFTFDLSDPANPRAVGEIQVPGFSSYIHPLDATHLLTIGTYLPPTPSDWRERALQLAIYDVSDFKHPRQTFTQEVGHAWAWSEAQWEHKAFNYFPEKRLLAIPFYDWRDDTGWSSYTSDLRVFRVDAAAGFAPLGALDMRDVLMRPDSSVYGCWYWWWQPMVRRSVMADDFVYAISSGGIRVANVADLSQPLATITFDYGQP